MKHPKIFAAFFAPIAAVALFLQACGGCQDRISGGESLVVEPVKVSQSSPTLIVTGALIPRDSVEIKTPFAAKIAEVYVNKGDGVIAGGPLAKFSEEETALKLNQLRTQLREIAAQQEKNSYLFKNRDRLMEEGKMDKTQYDGAEIENSNLDAQANRIKADIAAAEYNLAHLQINSPISGIVAEKYVSPLQVTGDEQLLFKLVNTDPIIVTFPLAAEESASVRLGQQIKVRIEELDNKEFTGTISFISPELHQQAMAFDVWAQIPNPEQILKAGMQAGVEIASVQTHNVIIVPQSAVISRDRDKFVFTVNSGVAKQTKVSIRNMHDGIAEISSGLSENDLIVAKGAQSLQNGAQVEVWRR